MPVYKHSGSNTFVEVCGGSLPAIKKVKIYFAEYDLNLEKGNRIVQNVEIYLSVDEAEYLGRFISSNLLEKHMQKNEEIMRHKGYKHPLPAYCTEPMGSNLKGNPIIHREMQINRSSSSNNEEPHYLLTAISGPGKVKKNDSYITIGDGVTRGLIQKNYTFKNPDNKITIPIKSKDIKKMGFALVRLIYAFQSAEYASYAEVFRLKAIKSA